MAEVRGDGRVTAAIADEALNLLDVDNEGFDAMDRRLLTAIVDKFGGGPVGLDALAAAISEERGTIEDVLDPYLIHQGRSKPQLWRRRESDDGASAGWSGKRRPDHRPAQSGGLKK